MLMSLAKITANWRLDMEAPESYDEIMTFIWDEDGNLLPVSFIGTWSVDER